MTETATISTNDYSVVIAGHGSRDPSGVEEFERLVISIKARQPDRKVEHGYLEFAKPSISQAVRKVIDQGSTRVVVVPALIGAASHAKNDMPGELQALRAEFPAVDLHFGAAMDLHPALLALCRERIIEAEAGSPRMVKRSDSCLVVVGRGTSDPDANSDISKLARMLEEGMGFGSAFVCYSGVARPLIADGLRTASRLGYQRMVVLPYLLFDGVLVKRIYAAADALAKRHPEIEVLKAKYLGVEQAVADVFLERAGEGVAGRAHMNCSLCKYRSPIVGFEHQLGKPLTARATGERQTLTDAPADSSWTPYQPHPIEAESFRLIDSGRDWSDIPEPDVSVVKRLVHTSGDFNIATDIFFSPGAVTAGMRALLRCRQVVADVTMVESGLKRSLLQALGISTWCGVHDPESFLISQSAGITRSAAGIRRTFERFGNDVVLAIGDAPTAVSETVRLVREQGWRPQLVIGLPVGFVGTVEAKTELRRLVQVPRITNHGTRGGSPWAASVVNALMILAVNHLARQENTG